MTKWINTPVDLSSHIRKNKIVNKIINPIFDKFLPLIDDPLWIDIFYKCARDKFPKGFMFQNGYLKFKKRNKTLQVMIPDCVEEALIVSKKFISENGSIFSDIDKKIQDDFIDSVSSKKEYLSFAEIKKNKLILNKYIELYIEKHGYDKKAMNYIISFAFDYGILNDKDVVFDNEIISIDGIVVKNNEYSIDESKLSRLNKKKTSVKTEKKTLTDETWSTYIKKLII